jgi:hypothetical protein
MRRHPRRRGTLLRPAALLLLATSAACHTWRTAPLPRAGSPASTITGDARLIHANGRVYAVTNAHVWQDTIRAGFRDAGGGLASAAVAVPLDSVRALKVRRLSWSRTLGLAAALFIGPLALSGILLELDGP